MFTELLLDRGQQIVARDPALAALDPPLDRVFLGAADDVLDHGPRGEVLEVQGFAVAIGVGDFEKLVFILG